MLPSSLLHFTNKHVTSDGYLSKIDTIEDSLRALSILLPGRFEDSDMCSQATEIKEEIEEEAPFNRRFEYNYSGKWSSKTASLALSIISYTEVIIEMVVSRKLSKNSRWRWIASLEGLKAILRLVLFYKSKKKMVLHPTHLIRNIDPSTLEAANDEKFELANIDIRTGTPLSGTLPNSTHVSISGTHRSGWAHLGEILWIIRPFVYAFMIMMEQRKQVESIKREDDDDNDDDEIEKDAEGSWKPWLISLAIDLISRTARYMQPMTGLEKDESRRRDYLFIYYLFRGPIYLKFTRLILDKFCDATEHRPIISIITAAINDYRPFWEDSYFYTSGS
ncbi:peroxisome membrane protein [Backusella circina FSU 941]|nr:peroxisome membrane protein [Backusella circina FSU 941]